MITAVSYTHLDVYKRQAYECVINNQETIKSRKCAILAFNDTVALGVLNACRDLGLKVPEDVQISGVGGLPIIAEIAPDLTTVNVFHERIASMGCEMLRSADVYKRQAVYGAAERAGGGCRD